MRRGGTLSRRGASALEFALVGVPLTLLMLGGLEVARYAATVTSLRVVTDEAARAATLRGYANLLSEAPACTGLAAGEEMVSLAGPTFLLNAGQLSIRVESCTTIGGMTTVGLIARYPYTVLLTLISPAGVTLTEYATASFS